jgi:hypothetical protein
MDICQKDLNEFFHHTVCFQEKNNFAGHIRTILKCDPLEYRGNRKGNQFSFWRYSQWAGIFYPVFYGQTDPLNPLASVELETRLNPVGRAGMFIITGMIILSLLPHSIHDLPHFITEISLRRLMILSAYFLVAALIIRQIYASIKKKAMADLEELIRRIHQE